MNPKPKKTLAIIAPYFPPHTGGLERYVSELALRLESEHGWRVVVITTGEKDAGDTRKETPDFTIYRLEYRHRFSNTPFALNWLWKVPSILGRENPDIVNVHMPVPGIADIAAFFTRGKPLVVTYHAGSMRKNRFVSDILVQLYEHGPLHSVLKRAERIICSSDFIRNEFLSRYADKSVTITPAVDSVTFCAENGAKDFPPTVLFVAGLGKSNQHKGLAILIDAMQSVQSAVPAARLIVVGEGDMRPAYEAYARKQGLKDAVIFKGELSGEALANAYRRAHVFALPSENDSVPTVILEAMASGLPVVATRIGGIPSVVEDGKTGFLIRPHDANGFAEKIAYLLKKPARAASFGAEARAKILTEYRWGARIAAYSHLLETFIESPPAIAHVIARYPPHLGGMERVAAESATFLARRGQAVVVLTASGTLRKSEIERTAHMTVKRLRSFEFAHIPFAPALLWHLARLPKETIIHLHLAHAYWAELVLLTAKMRGTRYVVHFHLDVAPSGMFGRLFLLHKKLIWGPLLRNADKVIACSPAQVPLLTKKYGVAPENIAVIPNAVSRDFFVDRTYASPEREFRLLSIGRLAPQKRLERLVEAMRHVSCPARLTIVGDGEERQKLENLAAAYGLTNVVFVGAKNDEKMRAYQKKSDAFVIASEREGVPLAVLEAMAAGLPVIGSNVIGIRELIGDVGLLVDEPYAEEFAKIIDQLWLKRERLTELSHASVRKAKEYSWEKAHALLENVYRSVRV